MSRRFYRCVSVDAKRVGVAIWLLLVTSLAAQQSPKLTISFKRDSYQIQESTEFKTKIIIHPVSNRGFFSYGISVQVSGPDGTIGMVNVTPTAKYNFDGPMAAGAFVSTFDDSAGVRGTLDFFKPTIPKPTAWRVATLTLQPLPPGEYVMKILPYRILGSTEQLFVKGRVQVPDDRIKFGTAALTVIAAPNNTRAKNSLGKSPRNLPDKMIRPQSGLSSAPISDSVRGLATTAIVNPTLSIVGGNYTLEFSTQAEVIYHIQYSSDLVTWIDAQPAVLGTGNRQKWVDSGLPGTESQPEENTARFYRIVIMDGSEK